MSSRATKPHFIFLLPLLLVFWLPVPSFSRLPLEPGTASDMGCTIELLSFLIHLGVFYLLGCASPRKWILLLILIALATEAAQGLITYRTYNLFDIFTNVTALLLGCVTRYFIIRLLRITQPQPAVQ
jgi:hypothetical protein